MTRPAAQLPFGGTLDLSGARLVAQGRVRFVYEHDAFPGLLIKIVKPADLRQKSGPQRRRLRSLFKLKRRHGIYNQIRREIAEYLAYVNRANRLDGNWPIARQYGFVETDQGVGFLHEKLAGPDGSLAPSIRELVQAGRFGPEHRLALEAFVQELIDRHVCVYDMNAGNIVYVVDPAGRGRCVAIDGLGANAALPLRDWFAWFNAWKTRQCAKARLWDYLARVDSRRIKPVTAGRNLGADQEKQASSLTEGRTHSAQ